MRLLGLDAVRQDEVWRRSRQGEWLRMISRQLSAGEREEISRGLAAGQGCRVIARHLGRSPSTISRELAHKGGPHPPADSVRWCAAGADG